MVRLRRNPSIRVSEPHYLNELAISELAEIKEAKGRCEEAIELFERTSRLDVLIDSARACCARVLQDADRASEAEELLAPAPTRKIRSRAVGLWSNRRKNPVVQERSALEGLLRCPNRVAERVGLSP